MKHNTKKMLSILSWSTHGAYVLVCAMAILMMLLPVPELSGWLKNVCVLLLGLSLGLSIFLPPALFGLGFNIALLIAQIVDKTEKRASRIAWQCVRTILCFAVCAALWYCVVVIFVRTTGGA